MRDLYAASPLTSDSRGYGLCTSEAIRYGRRTPNLMYRGTTPKRPLLKIMPLAVPMNLSIIK